MEFANGLLKTSDPKIIAMLEEYIPHIVETNLLNVGFKMKVKNFTKSFNFKMGDDTYKIKRITYTDTFRIKKVSAIVGVGVTKQQVFLGEIPNVQTLFLILDILKIPTNLERKLYNDITAQ